MTLQSLPKLSSRDASIFARTALTNVRRAYPNVSAHVVCSEEDLQPHQELHPAFYGSYDWHSAVHMHWLLARVMRLFPELTESSQITEVFNLHFTASNIATEIAYFQNSAHRSFERTYGWSWLLKLQTELIRAEQASSSMKSWSKNLQPLADMIAKRYLDFLPLAQFPIRAGTHSNSAFGLYFALEYARAVSHPLLEQTVKAKAMEWFGRDRNYPCDYEPGGDDFLSSGLMEAALMRQVLASQFVAWWQTFCPDRDQAQAWLLPVPVSDRSDPKLAHLDGLNLSRAWCWKVIQSAVPEPLASSIPGAVRAHMEASLPYISQGDYAGTHWLASFALLALCAD